MRNRFLRFAVSLLLMGIVAAACSNNNDNAGASGATSATGATGATCNPDIKVGIAFDVGGLGDKSFNDAANTGLQKAITDGLVCKDNVVTNEANASGSDRTQNVQALADAGFNLVIGVGFAFSPDINTIAPDFPDTSFMIVDGYATCGTACGLDNDNLANVADFTFKEQEGSFLVGAAAALKCQCDTIGFLGGQTGPLIQKFEAGYTDGAKTVNPNINVLVEYIGDDVGAFNDPVKGEALSTKMYDDGAEIIYHASGASGAGLFNAAVKADKLAIGVDSDQYLTASPEQQPLILTSMLKRVDTAVDNAIDQVGTDTFKAGPTVFGLADDGVDYSKSNTAELTQDIIDQLEVFRTKIVSGDIVVPEDPTKV